jgi:hypothetical protein
LISAQEFEKKYEQFEILDFKNKPHTFHGFWSYKLKVEEQKGHLLDINHFDQTMAKLAPILKIWRWHRPYEFDECFDPLKNSLKKVSDDYDKIRRFSLLEFDRVPTKELQRIWNELALCKPPSIYSGELVMAITKPLMFLWGQTPAFDSVVREKMPLFFISGFKNCRWEFSLFTSVLKRLEHVLLTNNELVASMRKTSIAKYGTEKTLPYGQFIDLCFWTASEKGGGCTGNDEEPIEPDVEKSIEEYQLFLELIDGLKRDGKISAEEWREYRDQWNNQKDIRPALLLRLKRSLN